MKIIATTGLPLAGKSVVTDKLAARGYKFFVMRTVVEEEMKKAGLEINNTNLRNFATELREKNGRGIVAELCIPHIDTLAKKEKVIVIDGVRSPEEVDVFKRQYGNDFLLLAVWASFSTRSKRIGNRKDHPKDEPANPEELTWRDGKEIGWGLAESIVKADWMIVNEGSKKEYEEEVDRILNKVLPTKG